MHADIWNALFVSHRLFFSLQGSCAQTDRLCGHQAHGARRVRVRMRRRPRPPHELRLAERVRDLASSSPGLHGRHRGDACGAGPHQGVAVLHAGPLPSGPEGARGLLEGLQPALHWRPGRAGGGLSQDSQRR